MKSKLIANNTYVTTLYCTLLDKGGINVTWNLSNNPLRGMSSLFVKIEPHGSLGCKKLLCGAPYVQTEAEGCAHCAQCAELEICCFTGLVIIVRAWRQMKEERRMLGDSDVGTRSTYFKYFVYISILNKMVIAVSNFHIHNIRDDETAKPHIYKV